MKGNSQIALFAVLIAFAGFRIYQKYAKKNNEGKSGIQKKQGSSFPTTSKDDDYEPYQKR
jgi:hypothetical protein